MGKEKSCGEHIHPLTVSHSWVVPVSIKITSNQRGSDSPGISDEHSSKLGHSWSITTYSAVNEIAARRCCDLTEKDIPGEGSRHVLLDLRKDRTPIIRVDGQDLRVLSRYQGVLCTRTFFNEPISHCDCAMWQNSPAQTSLR